VLASIRADCEKRAREIAKEVLGDIPVPLRVKWFDWGSLNGRKDDTQRGADDVAKTVTEGFIDGLKLEGVDNACVISV
jgi:hypothetical protein